MGNVSVQMTITVISLLVQTVSFTVVELCTGRLILEGVES